MCPRIIPVPHCCCCLPLQPLHLYACENGSMLAARSDGWMQKKIALALGPSKSPVAPGSKQSWNASVSCPVTGGSI